MEKNFVLKTNIEQKKNGFGVTLNSFADNKPEKLDINDILMLLNFTARNSEAIGPFEITTADLNDRETFTVAFNFLQIFDIENRYRLKGTIYEFWVCQNTILRKKITTTQLDIVNCRCCGKKNSKYRNTCWNCGTSF